MKATYTESELGVGACLQAMDCGVRFRVSSNRLQAGSYNRGSR
jgi:hypothetical protein